MFTGSWQPKIAALCAFLSILFGSLKAMFDSDPATVPNWELVITTGSLAWGLFMARQNNVTSEQVGATTKPDSILIPTATPPIVRATGEPAGIPPAPVL